MIISFLTLRIHPLLAITIAYMLGISCCPILPCFIFLAASLFLVLTAVGYHLITRKNLPKAFMLTLACLLAFCTGGINRDRQRQNQEDILKQLQEGPCDCIAQIASIDSADHPFYNQCITVNMRYLLNSANAWQALPATITVYTKPNDQTHALSVDDTIGINGLIFKKIKNGSFEDYLLKEGIAATLFMNEFNYIPLQRPAFSWRRSLFNVKYQTLHNIKRKMSPKTFQLFASIFLGNKQSPKKLTEKTKDHFTTWGVTHYLARSGLHMVIFVIIWQFLLNFLPIPWNFKELILLILGIIYCLLSWSSVSFNRALLTFLLYKICTLLRMQTNFLHLLTLVCLLILIHNPIQLFFLDFQLSFGLTFALGCFTQIQVHHKHQRYQTIAS